LKKTGCRRTTQPSERQVKELWNSRKTNGGKTEPSEV